MDTFGNRLKEALYIRRIKQVELSKALGIPKCTVSQYLQDVCEPKLDRFRQIADYLKVNYDWLAGYDAPIEKETEEHKALRQKIIEESMSLSNEKLEKVIIYINDIK